MDMVAILAGVSRASASYYFSPNPGNRNGVSQETASRLAEATRQLDYVPFANTEWFLKVGRHLPKADRHRSVDTEV